ncbi:unnamed protein product, partial [Rhizoctonia solani]
PSCVLWSTTICKGVYLERAFRINSPIFSITALDYLKGNLIIFIPGLSSHFCFAALLLSALGEYFLADIHTTYPKTMLRLFILCPSRSEEPRHRVGVVAGLKTRSPTQTIQNALVLPPSRDISPTRYNSFITDSAQSEQSRSRSQHQQLDHDRSPSRATSIASCSGTLNARSLSRTPTSQSRSRSGFIELDLDARARIRSRGVSFAVQSAGGI